MFLFQADGNQTINSHIIFHKPVLVRENLTVETINKHNASKLVTTNTNQNLSSPFNFKNKCTLASDLKVHGLINGINTTLWDKTLRAFSPEVQKVETDWNVLKNITFKDNLTGEGAIGELNLTHLAEEVEERRKYKYETEGEIIVSFFNLDESFSIF